MIVETWLPFCYDTALLIESILLTFFFFNLARVFIELF